MPIADARVLGNVLHAQADLTLLVSGEIPAFLGTGRRSRHHHEQNLLSLSYLTGQANIQNVAALGLQQRSPS
jgi:hypothetical protein